MAKESSVIETGVDKLVILVRDRKRISVQDAAKALGVGASVVEEWADFLEEEGIISIEYKFATPYLVERKLSTEEVKDKEKEFHSKKEGFVRKAEATLSILDREGDYFQKFKDNFEKLKKDLGTELEHVESELEQLEKFEHLKRDVDKQIGEQEKQFKDKVDSFEREVSREQGKYKEILESIDEEEEKLDKERLEAISLREKEILIKRKVDEFQEDIGKIMRSIKEEDTFITDSEKRLKNLKRLAETIKNDIITKKASGEKLIRESNDYAKKIAIVQSDILSKVAKNKIEMEKKINEGKVSTTRFKEFFNKKNEIETLIKEADKQKNELEYDLVELIKKAKAFHISSNSSELKSHVKDLEKKFENIKKKKDKFEQETVKLGSLLKS